MEQRALVADRGGILNHQRAGRERGGQIGLAQRVRGNDARARRRRPDRRQMRLAGSFRPDQRDGARRPIRPAIDQRQRAGVARPGQKILARVAFGMIERERELARA